MSHNNCKRFPNSSLAIPQQTLLYATETFAARHWASSRFSNKDDNLQTGNFHTRQENIRDQNRTTRREARERRITPFDLHHQRIRLPHDRNRSERQSNRERIDKTHPCVGSGVWLLQRSNEARSPGHVQRENPEQTRADWRRDRKPVRNKTPAHHEVALPNAANK